MPSPKFTITLPETISEQIDTRSGPGLDRGGGQRSPTIAKSLDRYFFLLSQSRATMRSQQLFSEQELGLLCDALNGSLWNETRTIHLLPHEVADAIQLDGLAAKWEVDGPQLLDKLKKLDRLSIFALVDGIEIWWERQSRGEEIKFSEVLN